MNTFARALTRRVAPSSSVLHTSLIPLREKP
jgi:hypothetical protein